MMKFPTQTFLLAACLGGMVLGSCAPMNVPKGRTVDIPPAAKAPPRSDAINEGRESVMTIPLSEDVLVPALKQGDTLPSDIIGPYELRNETLAGALQLVLAGYDIPLAFQTDEGLTRQVTVSNLKGTVDQVVRRLCGLADLYCSYDDEILEVKETETFTVSLPPLEDGAFDSIAAGLAAVSGAETVIDTSTRTLIYSISQRNAKRAAQYFDRLRANTALIVYETYIWEVQLDSANSAGINWERLGEIGAFNSGVSLSGAFDSQVGTPITIGLPTKSSVNLADGDVFQFLSNQGAVKTISQPQLTVLSGSSANLSVIDTRNYISSISRTTDENGDDTFATTTDTVESGLTLDIASSWDESTVYANIELELDEFLEFEPFDAGNGDELRLPRTSQRELTTQVRARPGDSILIAGLVRENDQYSAAGLGLTDPIVPTSRAGSTSNSELVILLRPRVIRYVNESDMVGLKKLFKDEKPFNLFNDDKDNEDVSVTDMFNPSYGITPMEVK
jgi:hypothetical protein